MNKLISFAAIGAGLLFVSACVGFMTAGPSIAKGGLADRDVRVVNTASEAVPVNVTALPAVQIGGTPTVHVGNGAGSPVPVTVTNLPAVQAPEETLSVHTLLVIGPGDYNGSGTPYTVPAGKRLLITYVHFEALDIDAGDHILLVSTPGNSFHFLGSKEFQGYEYDSESCEISADEGVTVEFHIHKDVANPANATTSTNVVWSGHLVDMP